MSAPQLLDRIASASSPAELLEACARIEAQLASPAPPVGEGQGEDDRGCYPHENEIPKPPPPSCAGWRARVAENRRQLSQLRDDPPTAGRISAHVVSDGSFLLDGGTVFGALPRALWEREAKPDRQNRIRLGLNSLLVKTPAWNILVNAGIGGKDPETGRTIYGHSSSKLARNLKRHGVQPGTVSAVVLTDLAFFHSGGVTKLDREGELTSTFPKAKVLVQRKAWESAFNPDERILPNLGPGAEHLRLLEQRGQVVLLDGDTELTQGVQLVETGGFSPGHQVVLVNTGSERIAYLAGTVPTPAHMTLPCITALDHSPAETLAAKKQLLQRAEAEGWLLVFAQGYHEQAGYIERRNGTARLRPVGL